MNQKPILPRFADADRASGAGRDQLPDRGGIDTAILIPFPQSGEVENDAGRRALGLAVVGGFAFSQLVTPYVTPIFYIWLDRLHRRRDTAENG